MLVSDNGASGEGGPNGSVNENKFFNGIPDDIQENLQYLEELGSPATYNHYPVGWAWAFNTPFKMWKRYNFEGGVADPLLISWPRQIKARGELRHQFATATDLVPTIYDCIGLELPEVVKGFTQIPLEGVSLRSTFESDDVPHTQGDGVLLDARVPCDLAQGLEGGERASHDRRLGQLRQRPLGAPTTPTRTPPRPTTWRPSIPPSCRADQPLVPRGSRYRGLPRTAPRSRSSPTDPTPGRPPARPGVYYPGAAEVPETAAANIRNRSYSIAVGSTSSPRTPPECCSPTGPVSAATACHIKDRKLKYVYNFVSNEQMVESTREVPPARCCCRPPSSRRATPCPPPGRCRCSSTTRRSAKTRIMTQPGNFSLVGEGLNVGKDPGEPVTADCGHQPFPFTGGTIAKAIVVGAPASRSSTSREAIAMMARE